MSEQKTHVLKTIPPFFEHVQRGRKTFELRKNDRGFRVGDLLVLKEYLPATEQYTGAQTIRQVDYIIEDFQGLEPGYCIMGISVLDEYPF